VDWITDQRSREFGARSVAMADVLVQSLRSLITGQKEEKNYHVIICQNQPLSFSYSTRDWKEYQPKCDDALLGNKGRYGSFHMWINVWLSGKTV